MVHTSAYELLLDLWPCGKVCLSEGEGVPACLQLPLARARQVRASRTRGVQVWAGGGALWLSVWLAHFRLSEWGHGAGEVVEVVVGGAV